MFIDVIIIVNKEIIIQQTFWPRREVMTFSRNIISQQDRVGGMGNYGSSKKYLHIAIDSFTRFDWIVTSKTQTGKDFVNLINKVITLRKPKLVVADQYTGIKSTEFRQFLENKDIKLMFTPKNHPESNGMVERVNQTLCARIRQRILETPKERRQISWTTIATNCVEEYNKTIHSTTKFPPIYLLTGEDHDKLIRGNKLEENRKIAFQNSCKNHDENKMRFDKHQTNEKIEVGQMVYVETGSKLNRGKLDPLYEGPYKVTDKVGTNMLQVKKNNKKDWFHIAKIKPAMFGILLILSLMIEPIRMMNETDWDTISDFETDDPPPFETVDPVIWVKTNHKLASVYTLNYVVLKILDPCVIARKEKLLLPNDLVDCIMAQREIENLLSANCPGFKPLESVGHNTRKRSVTGIVTAGAMLFYIASTVIGMVGQVWNQWVHTDMKQMNEQIKMTKRYEEQFANKTVDTFKNLMSDMDELVDQISEELKSLRNGNRIVTQIKITEPILMRFFKMAKQKKVIPEFDYLFPNITLEDKIDKRYWELIRCESRNKGYISLEIITPKVKPDEVILKAHSFTIYKRDGKGETAYKYVGPKFLVMNEKNGCIKPIHIEPKSHEPEVFLSLSKPLDESCGKFKLNEAWKKTTTTFGELSYEKIQTYVDENAVYLYCNGSTIEFREKRYRCENFVYRLDRNQEFMLNSVKYKMLGRNVTGTLLTDKLKDRLTKKVLGGLTNFRNYKKELRNLDLLVKELDQEAKKYWEVIPQYEMFWGIVASSIVIISLLLATIFVAIGFCKMFRKNRKMKKRLKRTASQLMQMEVMKNPQYRTVPYQGRY
nr:uncharacterized protein LOC124499206 [Dermatophagoides farinae]